MGIVAVHCRCREDTSLQRVEESRNNGTSQRECKHAIASPNRTFKHARATCDLGFPVFIHGKLEEENCVRHECFDKKNCMAPRQDSRNYLPAPTPRVYSPQQHQHTLDQSFLSSRQSTPITPTLLLNHPKRLRATPFEQHLPLTTHCLAHHRLVRPHSSFRRTLA